MAAARRNLSTFDVAAMLEVDPGSVANWIDAGMLQAHRTPGGHRRVASEDLVAFLRAHRMPIPEALNADPTRVLVVDDEPALAALVAKAIRAAHPHLEVVEAHDGFQAGTLVATLKPAVVVLDLKMPGLDGFAVCKAIKDGPATKDAVVIAMTAYPSDDSHKRICECGAKLCLSKPLDLGQLVAEVTAVVEAL